MKKKNNSSIYIIEDDPLYLNAIEFFLRHNANPALGIESFSNGGDCLSQVRTHVPDIVLLGYEASPPGGINGIGILKMLKVLNKDTEVIMLSSHKELEIAVDCVRSGAYDYIVKNESAFLRLRHQINLILYNIDLRKKRSLFVAWNLGLAAAFMIFFLTLILYAFNHPAA